MAQPPKSDESNADTSTESTPSTPASSADGSPDATAASTPEADDAADTPEDTGSSETPVASDDGSGDESGADESQNTEETEQADDSPAQEPIAASPAPIEDAVHPDAPDAASLPSTFEEMGLPDAMRSALASLGWGAPTKVQAAAFGPVTAGRDVLVQSQTGSGKTGAFCLPWLAARFESGDAKETGVQLLVMTPTRELAKQVCDQLVNLAGETPLVPLPVYGGTAIGPQFDALKAGVHAVVGTPGRILDHIRRRTLDLSKVRTVVLDEADEMLSMGFLEDIHAILDACPRERQTTLFSATVPSDIERIARRYMNDPESLKLSGDDIAAAQIEHMYYSVPGAMRTRDLLSIVAQEEPGSTLIFCNTREETNLVANVLRREGFSAEALSSDLSQAAREHVLGAMRKGRLRFLVATDVASRGIDISHISHVVNYSFPQNAESYVHRTGRTGRAGRAGKAISLIGPHDMGNFYHLKLQYPSIEFSEAKLPSKDEQEARRKETKLDHISKRFPELVSPEWTLLARTLAADPRGEQVMAFLLSEAMSKPDPATQVQRDLPEEDDEGGRWGRRERRGRGRDGDRDRDQRGRGDRDRDDRGRRDRGDRRRDRDDREDRGRRRDRRDGRRDEYRDAQAESDAPRDEALNVEGQDSGEAPARRRRRRRRRDEERETSAEAVELAEGTEGEDAPEADAATGHAETDDANEDAELSADGEARETEGETDGETEGEASGGRRRRRRRRRRRGGGAEADAAAEEGANEARDEETGPSEPAPTEPELVASAQPDGDASTDAAAEGDDASGETSDESADDAGATEGDPEALTAAPCEATDGLEQTDDGTSARGRRRRRRRRRRGGRGKGDAQAAADDTEASEEPSEGEDALSADAEGDDAESNGKRRRRRRRGGRGKKAEAPVEQHVPQDQIIIDIDETELEVVRDEFGEIDELDDLTLKGRRRGVIDALQDEVELEDMSEEDTPPADETSEDEDNGEDGSDEDGSDEAADDEAADGESSDEADGEPEELDEKEAKKRKRRRRRRKKKKAEEPPPELTAPPHKDFWEVWSSKFTFREFEDDQFRGGTEAIVDEPEPEPKPKRTRRKRDDDKDPAKIGTEDGPMVTVALNVGRSHGKKSAHIRELLASDFGLEGRSVRNLTVKETLTEFRISTSAHDGLQAAVLGYVFDDIELELTVVEPAPTVEEPAPAAEETTEGSGDDSADAAPEAEAADEASAVPDPAVLATTVEGEPEPPQPEV